MVWLTGGSLVLALLMIVGLIALVAINGLSTFWPHPVVEMRLADGTTWMGEIWEDGDFALGAESLAVLPAAERERARQTLKATEAYRTALPEARARVLAQAAEAAIEAARPLVRIHQVTHQGRTFPDVVEAWTEPATWTESDRERRRALLADVKARLGARMQAGDDPEAAAAGAVHDALAEVGRAARDRLAALLDLDEAGRTALPDVDGALLAEADVAVQRRAIELGRPRLERTKLRTGNFELLGEHFKWMPAYDVLETSEPEWAVTVERLEWGRFYGVPVALLEGDRRTAETSASAWARFEALFEGVAAQRESIVELEREDLGELNHAERDAALHVREAELDHGTGSTEHVAAQAALGRLRAELAPRRQAIEERIAELRAKNAEARLLMRVADGTEVELPLAKIVRAYRANQVGFFGRLGIYMGRWWECLTAEPREANSEGGVWPAIFGTIVMTLLMTLLVVPFGVLAALYLREYAKQGFLISLVRVAVGNLAGVPSIVFGVFGLGFFCYLLGGSIDATFFEAKLPQPTFGTGGLLWASLTLALLTLPVVVVATEEALSAVPNSMREGSYAAGASKWQTIRRIVLPQAAPGIMTGTILAIARGAGEVAPLMLVGAVKLAPELPVDGDFPFVHPERSFMHLGFHIFDLGFQSQNSEAARPMVYTTTLLLIGIVVVLNVVAIKIRARLRRAQEA